MPPRPPNFGNLRYNLLRRGEPAYVPIIDQAMREAAFRDGRYPLWV
jgi:hypothetical protein